MTQLTTLPNTMSIGLNYRQIPLNDLLHRLIDYRDKAALDEFHNHRTLFQFQDRSKLLFAQFINALRDGCLGTDYSHQADEAYNMTLDKFSRLPGKDEKGVNCVLYFQAAIKLLRPTSNPIQTEVELAQILQRLAFRHYKLSLLETHRRGAWTRYVWRPKGQKIPLLLPKELSGTQRKAWLEKNIGDSIPQRYENRHLIQMSINGHFQTQRLKAIENPVITQSEQDLPWKLCDNLSIDGIVKTLAEEKADRFLEQRPSIRNIGQKKLKLLIHEVFEAAQDRTNCDSNIARKFGLSKASFSRFAGSQWTYPNTPDLWRNLAHLIAHHPVMKETAQHNGVWNTIKAIDEYAPPIVKTT